MKPIMIQLDPGDAYYKAHPELDPSVEVWFYVTDISVCGYQKDAEVTDIEAVCKCTGKPVTDDNILEALTERVLDHFPEVVFEIAEENAQGAAEMMYDQWKEEQ